MMSPEFAEECLKYHNTFRALHNAPDLVIDIKLNDFAQDWADVIAAEDIPKYRQENDYGENIFVCYSEDSECDLEPRMPVQTWYDEMSAYEFGSEPSAVDICKVGHFTQLVWRDSKRLGIGMAASECGNVYVVCYYQPAGNIIGEFADNVAPKKDDDGADSGVPDQSTDAGSTLDLNATRLKVIPEEEMRVWSAWLTKVAEVALGEWQEWLQEHIHLASRINDQLLKARREIEEQKGRHVTTAVKPSESGCIEGTLEKSNAATTTHDNDDDGDKEAVDDKEEDAFATAAEKADFCRILKRIPVPRDAEEMFRIARQFRRRAKKFQSLYAYWLAQGDRVMEEIGGKSTAEQVYTHEEIPSFFYLRDEADIDIRIDENDNEDDDDDDDDDDVKIPSGPLERITCRGDLHLFFNLTDKLGGTGKAIFNEPTKD